MGLLHYLLLSVLNLLFGVMDILVMMILIKVAYDKWKFPWLQPFALLVEPTVKSVADLFGGWLSKKTGRVYPVKTQLICLIISLWFMQVLLSGLAQVL